MKSALTVLAVLVLAMGAQGAVTIVMTDVEDAGNAADQGLGGGGSVGEGSVAYEYQIATTEVTNDQYAEMLNAVAASDPNGLYNPNMATDPEYGFGAITRSGSDGSYTYSVLANMGNKPVVYVSAVDALRFVNWLHNGQPTGAQTAATTEDGVYEMLDAGTVANHLSPRKVSDSYFLPTHTEWYKAAYHDPRLAADGGPPADDNYWLTPLQIDATFGATSATQDAAGDVTNPGPGVVVATSNAAGPASVGQCGNTSYWGAYDMAGNAYEFTETYDDESTVVVRGGGFSDAWYYDVYRSLADTRIPYSPTGSEGVIGFRVAHAAIPPLPGDTDDDGDVDLDDFNVLKGNFESGPGRTWAEGDFTGDGEVKLDDFVLLKNNFTGGAAVPEPATLSLLAIAACLPLRRRRK